MIRKAVTIKDVAQAAGVSTGSVSRVLNGYDVNPEIRERVRSMIEKMNYYPTVSTQVSKTRSGTITVLLSSRLLGMHMWTQQVVTDLAVVLGRYGYRTLLRIQDEDDAQVPRELLTVEGCMVWGKFSESFFKEVEKGNPNLAVVSYSRRIPLKNAVSVIVDHKRSMFRVIEYLVARNHREIGFVTPLTRTGHHFERQQGFLEAMGKFNCQVRDEWVGLLRQAELENTGIRAGHTATNRILDLGRRPSAIVYASDLLAYGGMEAIKQRGLAIPKDYAIVGFDDLPPSRDTFPPLTTMRMDTAELARTLVDALERLLLGRGAEPEVILSRTLVERESVAVRTSQEYDVS